MKRCKWGGIINEKFGPHKIKIVIICTFTANYRLYQDSQDGLIKRIKSYNPLILKILIQT